MYIEQDLVSAENEKRQKIKKDAILRAIEEEHQSRMDSLMITMRGEEKTRMIKRLQPGGTISRKTKPQKERIKKEYKKSDLILEESMRKYQNMEVDVYGNAVPKKKVIRPGFRTVKNKNHDQLFNDYS